MPHATEPQTPRCTGCGRPLPAASPRGRCPHCGAANARPTARKPIADAELKRRWRWWEVRPPRRTSSVLREPVCDQCAYSLRGLPAAGRCPECGNLFDLGKGLGARERDARVSPRTAHWLALMFKLLAFVSACSCVFGGILMCLGVGPMLLAVFVAGMCALLWWAFTGQLDIDVRWKRADEEEG